MKLIVALSVVLAVAAAAPQEYRYNNDNVQLTRFDIDNIGTGSYKYAYEQTDGTKQEQQGEIVNEGREDENLVVTGIFSWIAPNGIRYTVRYVSDKNGYQPELEEGPGGVPGSLLASLAGAG